ncbi:hypothetical protein TI04_05360 [Achromatium sp. WMS2]|nr:hypothetical protein TI04_05360 [Achromatium sp. WMS2]
MLTVKSELPIAIVQGQHWTQYPKDVYIPENALEISVDEFTGPLDLLLYLIKKQNFDILNIPIVKITAQYMEYIGMMQELNLEPVAEYLAMAALLAEIKSRMLLPNPESNDNEKDPRSRLAEQLYAYNLFQQAAATLDKWPRLERDNFVTKVMPPNKMPLVVLPTVRLEEIVKSIQFLIEKNRRVKHHSVLIGQISVKDRIFAVLQLLTTKLTATFSELLLFDQGRMGVIVTFMAILELVKTKYIELTQDDVYILLKINPDNLDILDMERKDQIK